MSECLAWPGRRPAIIIKGAVRGFPRWCGGGVGGGRDRDKGQGGKGVGKVCL